MLHRMGSRSQHLARTAHVSLNFKDVNYTAGCFQVVELVAERVSAQGVACLVVDPVLVSTSGHSLGDSDVARALVSR